jgi:DNA-binding Lrp family transcriptional regulator
MRNYYKAVIYFSPMIRLHIRATSVKKLLRKLRLQDVSKAERICLEEYRNGERTKRYEVTNIIKRIML